MLTKGKQYLLFKYKKYFGFKDAADFVFIFSFPENDQR